MVALVARVIVGDNVVPVADVQMVVFLVRQWQRRQQWWSGDDGETIDLVVVMVAG